MTNKKDFEDVDAAVNALRKSQEESAQRIKELLEEYPDFFSPASARERLRLAKEARKAEMANDSRPNSGHNRGLLHAIACFLLPAYKR